MRKFLFLLIFLLLLSSVSAEVLFKQGTNLTLKVPCIKNDAPCGLQTRCNMSIIESVNGSYVVNNLGMDNIGNGDFQFNLSFSNYGDHVVKMFCSDSGTNVTSLFLARVTQSGQQSSLGEGIVYMLLSVIVLVFFLFTMYSAFNLDGEDKFSIDGDLLQVTYGKYLKMFLFFVGYLELWVGLFLIWQISEKFLTFPFMTDILRLVFLVVSWAIIPVVLMFISLCVVKFVGDIDAEKLMRRGLKPR